MKHCKSCGLLKEDQEFYKKKNSLSYLCKPCTRAENKRRQSKYIGKYADYQNAWKRLQTQLNTDYNKRRKEKKANAYQLNKDIINEDKRNRYQVDSDFKASCLSRCSSRRKHKPKWVDLKPITQFYKNCPEGYEVDHIIPLNGIINGRKVCGLHVLCNLQYLTKEENRKKYNIINESIL